jgi:hypothetical protein
MFKCHVLPQMKRDQEMSIAFGNKIIWFGLAINEVTGTVVHVTFCDRIQYIMESRKQLFENGLLKYEWGSGVF